MNCGRPATMLCAAGMLLLSFDTASAQQPAAAAPIVFEGALVVADGQAATPVPSQTPTTKPPRELPSRRPPQVKVPSGQKPLAERVASQGFSVVLVVADLTASGGQSDVPPAAQRALTDIKDFLPYKSYKLLDAAWLLGQGQQTIRLRGPEEQEYELRLVTPSYSTDSGRLSVQFLLRDAPDAAAEAAVVGQSMEYADAERRAARLRTEMAQAREKKDQEKVRELEKEIRALPAARAAARTSLRKGVSHRAIIETSFTMEVGETVVVGTSRLKGNSRALIALLTAVPPRGGSSPDQSR